MWQLRQLITILCGFSIVLILTGCAIDPLNIGTAPTPAPIFTLKNGGACVKLGTHPTQPYANIQASHDTYADHSEPDVAENPNNPLNLIGGSKFFTDPNHYQFKIGTYTSFDGGCTWSDGGVLPGFDHEALTSDVTFDFGTQNDAYVAVLNTDNANESGISVSTSHDGGKTFGLPVSVYDDTTGTIFSDKPWIGIDDTDGPNRGDIYVVWSYDYNNNDSCGAVGNPPCTQELAFSRSTDGGKTFAPVKQIEGTAPFCTNSADGRPRDSRKCDAALGAIPAVLPDGTLAVAFAYVDLNASDPDSGAAPSKPAAQQLLPTKMLVVTSPDGGATWTNPVLIATIHDLPVVFAPERYRNFSLPAFADDPKTGQLYLTWSDEQAGDADIVLTTSRDHGVTWSSPMRVNDDPLKNGANQFQPQIAVAPDGVVSVAFFDTRNDPTHKLIDVYLAQSDDHGATFHPNVRVTTESWDPTVKAPLVGNGLQFIGDYQGLAVDDHFAHPFWNDTRTSDQEIFTAAVPSVQPKGERT
jgi:hypothetical protein